MMNENVFISGRMNFKINYGILNNGSVHFCNSVLKKCTALLIVIDLKCNRKKILFPS